MQHNKMRSRAAFATLFALSTLSLLPGMAKAQVAPLKTMNFQGRLAKPDGTPVPDSSAAQIYSVTFSLWDSATVGTGTQLWAGSAANVTVRNGTFATRLDFSGGFSGSNTLGSVFGGSPIYLQIVVNGTAQSPRQPLLANAYAFLAGSALTVPDGSITRSKIADGAVGLNQLAPLNGYAWLLGGNSGVTNGFLGTTDGNPLAFRTGNAERMRILAGGNIGIGTGTPLAGLMVQTHDNWNPDTNLNNGWGDFVIGDGARGLVFGLASSGGGAGATRIWTKGGAPLISLGSAANSDVLNVYGNNVGVGVLPGTRFEVLAGTLGATAGNTLDISNQWGTTTNGVQLKTRLLRTAAGSDWTSAALLLQRWTDVTPQATIALYGDNVGIATTTPAYPLDVNGTIRGQFALINGGSNYGTLGSVVGGVYGSASNNGGSGVYGVSPFGKSGYGVYGSGDTAVYGVDTSGNQIGSLGSSTFGGVYGYGTTGVYARARNTTTANGQALYANGPAGGTTNWNGASDARYKAHVVILDNALDTVLNLRGVHFDWRQADFPDKNFPAGRQVGFIAQEIEKFLPEVVSTDAQGYKSVAYSSVVPVLVEAIKAQQKQIEAQQRQMDDLKAAARENAELKRRLDALTAAVEKLTAAHK